MSEKASLAPYGGERPPPRGARKGPPVRRQKLPSSNPDGRNIAADSDVDYFIDGANQRIRRSEWLQAEKSLTCALEIRGKDGGESAKIPMVHGYKEQVVDLWVSRARARMCQFLFPDAHTDLDFALLHIPNHIDALLWSGILCDLQEKKEEALTFYLKAVELSDASTEVGCEARWLHAIHLLKCGLVDEAISICSNILEAFPNSVAALVVRGDGFKYGGKGYAYIDDYAKAMSLDEAARLFVGRGFHYGSDRRRDFLKFISAFGTTVARGPRHTSTYTNPALSSMLVTKDSVNIEVVTKLKEEQRSEIRGKPRLEGLQPPSEGMLGSWMDRPPEMLFAYTAGIASSLRRLQTSLSTMDGRMQSTTVATPAQVLEDVEDVDAEQLIRSAADAADAVRLRLRLHNSIVNNSAKLEVDSEAGHSDSLSNNSGYGSPDDEEPHSRGLPPQIISQRFAPVPEYSNPVKSRKERAMEENVPSTLSFAKACLTAAQADSEEVQQLELEDDGLPAEAGGHHLTSNYHSMWDGTHFVSNADAFYRVNSASGAGTFVHDRVFMSETASHQHVRVLDALVGKAAGESTVGVEQKNVQRAASFMLSKAKQRHQEASEGVTPETHLQDAALGVIQDDEDDDFDDTAFTDAGPSGLRQNVGPRAPRQHGGHLTEPDDTEVLTAWKEWKEAHGLQKLRPGSAPVRPPTREDCQQRAASASTLTHRRAPSARYAITTPPPQSDGTIAITPAMAPQYFPSTGTPDWYDLVCENRKRPSSARPASARPSSTQTSSAIRPSSAYPELGTGKSVLNLKSVTSRPGERPHTARGDEQHRRRPISGVSASSRPMSARPAMPDRTHQPHPPTSTRDPSERADTSRPHPPSSRRAASSEHGGATTGNSVRGQRRLSSGPSGSQRAAEHSPGGQSRAVDIEGGTRGSEGGRSTSAAGRGGQGDAESDAGRSPTSVEGNGAGEEGDGDGGGVGGGGGGAGDGGGGGDGGVGLRRSVFQRLAKPSDALDRPLRQQSMCSRATSGSRSMRGQTNVGVLASRQFMPQPRTPCRPTSFSVWVANPTDEPLCPPSAKDPLRQKIHNYKKNKKR